MTYINKNLSFIILIGIIASTIYVFWDVGSYGFTNWDDHEYVRDNELILSTNTEGYTKLLTRYSMGNYHPLTMLSLAVDYRLGGRDTGHFHRVNILLHLINTLLVFFLFHKLAKNKAGRDILSLFATAVFALHPLHVESVAWVSGRKDLLYTLFYLCSLLLYLRYRRQNNRLFYLLSILAFALSCLSKAMAVTLPLALLVLDFLEKRSLKKKANWKNKIPYFALSLLFGTVALHAQQDAGAIYDSTDGFREMLMSWTHTLSWYPIKFIAPLNLTAFYSYPEFQDMSLLAPPLLLKLMLILAIGASLALSLAKYRYMQWARIWAAGWAFLYANLLLVVQFIPVGTSLTHDRYTYLAYIGLAGIAGWLLGRLGTKNKALAWSIALLLATGMAWASKQQSKSWESSKVLWGKVLKNHPDEYKALINMGNAYADEANYEQAAQHYEKALEINPEYADTWNNLGNIMIEMQDYTKALHYLEQAQERDPENPKVHYNLGLAYTHTGQTENAIASYRKAIELDPYSTGPYSNLSGLLFQMGQRDEAFRLINKALQFKPDDFGLYLNRGVMYGQMRKMDAALADFRRAEQLNDQNSNLYVNMANVLAFKQQYNQALMKLEKAIRLDPQNAMAYLVKGRIHYQLQNIQAACQAFSVAAELGNPAAAQYQQQYCK